LNPRLAGAQRFTLRSPSKDGRHASILLVEDNPGDATLVRTALEHHEVEGEVILLTDGEKAIGYVEAVDTEDVPCPDLIIIDLNLPKKSGHEVLQRMRLSAKCSQVPILILSSSDAASDRLHAARLGASLYISKPLRLDEFMKLGAIFKEKLGSG